MRPTDDPTRDSLVAFIKMRFVTNDAARLSWIKTLSDIRWLPETPPNYRRTGQ